MTTLDAPGFNQPQHPKDELTAQLYQEHNLGLAPSLEEIEPVATVVLASPMGLIEGASLVLGRNVASEERELLSNLLFAGNAENRFGLLLLAHAAEIAENSEK